MDYKILDREFRDYTAELKYPFSDEAILGSSSGLTLPAGAFLDMLVYVPNTVAMPIYLSSLRSTDNPDKAIMELRDSSDDFVADCELDINTDNGTLVKDNIPAGSVVFDPVIMRQLIHACHGGPVIFGTNVPIQTGRCFQYEPPHIIGIKDSAVDEDGEVHKDTVYIVGANGVHFTTAVGGTEGIITSGGVEGFTTILNIVGSGQSVDVEFKTYTVDQLIITAVKSGGNEELVNTGMISTGGAFQPFPIVIPVGTTQLIIEVIGSGPGTAWELNVAEIVGEVQPGVYVHLLGEEPPVDKPVRSVNSIAKEKLWFAAHPNSGVKIETITNGIRIRSILDE